MLFWWVQEGSQIRNVAWVSAVEDVTLNFNSYTVQYKLGTKLIYQKLQGLKVQITEGFMEVFHL